MKKTRFILSVFLLAFTALILTACSVTKDISKSISKEIEIDLDGATITKSMDSHGGFHGDGTAYAEITFTDDKNKAVIEGIRSAESWRELPLTDNLNIAVNGKISASEYAGPYISNNKGEALFPKVDNGYYFFYDRHSQSEDAKDDTNLFNRYSLNFTIAIHDTDAQTLYYCRMDT